MEKTVRITADNGAIVNVVLDHIDGDDVEALAVAQACIEANKYDDFDQAGDIYDVQYLSVLVKEHYDAYEGKQDTQSDKAGDGSSSGYMIEIAGFSVLWHTGISDDCGLTIAPSGTTIEQWVRNWDDNGREYAAAWGFGWDRGTAEVSEDFYGEVVIQVTTHFFAGTLGNKTSPHLLKDEEGDVIVFEDFQAAKAWIDEQDEYVYVLAHGEYSRPDYQIMDASII